MVNKDFNLSPPYFIFLKGEFYDKFISGKQNIEVRPNNHGGWNKGRIYPGRLVWISRGYGKEMRRLLRIRDTKIVKELSLLPQWHGGAVLEIYGERESWLLAYLEKATPEELTQELARQAKIKSNALPINTTVYKEKNVYLKQNKEFAFKTKRYADAQATRLESKWPDFRFQVFSETKERPYFFVEVQPLVI